MQQEMVRTEFQAQLTQVEIISGTALLSIELGDAEPDTLRMMTDIFRSKYSSGVIALGSVLHEKPMLICAVTDDLIKKGLIASDLVRKAAELIGGSGGGKPNLAQAGGKKPEKIQEALDLILTNTREFLRK